MTNRQHKEVFFKLAHPSDNVSAVILARQIAGEIGFGDIELSLIATSVSELSTNIIKYAHSGSLKFYKLTQDGVHGIEIIAEDSGPGIPDTSKAMNDEYSTGGSLGLGLPGVKRMMDEFELKTTPGTGTCVIIRKWKIIS